MKYPINIIDRKEKGKAIVYRVDGGFSTIGRYRPSGFVEGETEYFHFDERFEKIVGNLRGGIFVPVFVPRGMDSTSERYIKFRGEGLEFILDLEEDKILDSTSVQVQ